MTETIDRSAIPAQAEEVPDETTPFDLTFRCVLNGEIVGYRARYEDGALMREHAVRNGVRHGLERHWAPDGTLEFETCYVEGLEHGVASQWNQGRLVGTYRLEHGTGVDLWRSSDGTLSEERHYERGERHGFERWWSWDNATVRQEEHFEHGVAHGVFRHWNHRGRIRRGYPQYFVDGRKVSKRQYLRASAVDSSLPRFSETDHLPERELPTEYLRAAGAETKSPGPR